MQVGVTITCEVMQAAMSDGYDRVYVRIGRTTARMAAAAAPQPAGPGRRGGRLFQTPELHRDRPVPAIERDAAAAGGVPRHSAARTQPAIAGRRLRARLPGTGPGRPRPRRRPPGPQGGTGRPRTIPGRSDQPLVGTA